MTSEERCYAVVEMRRTEFSQIVEIWDSMDDAYDAAHRYNEKSKESPLLHYIIWPTFYCKPS